MHGLFFLFILAKLQGIDKDHNIGTGKNISIRYDSLSIISFVLRICFTCG